MGRTAVFLLILVLLGSAVPVSAEKASTPHDTDPYDQIESVWSEAERGPLPRYRLGPNGENATPEPDPNQPLHPYSIDLSRRRLAPDHCLVESPAEYTPTRGVLYRYALGAWDGVVTDLVAALTGDPAHDEIAYVVVSNATQQQNAESAFTAAGADLSKVSFILAPTDTIWMRDYGPHFIWQGGAKAIVDSHYYRFRALDNFIPTLVGDDYFVHPTYDIGLYYSGGNFQPTADRQGFVTALIHSDNPGFGETFIAELYNEYQGIDTLHILSQLPGSVDGTGHIDMWLYIVDEDTVIISEFLPGSNQTAIDITNNAVPYMEGLGYEVFRVPAWNATHPGRGNTHYTYTNAFRVNDRIFIPTYGQGDPSYLVHDDDAIAAWEAAAGPGVEIVPINSYDIIWAAGAIHCIVMQVPAHTDTLPSSCTTSPGGGEVLVPNSTHEVTWTASDDGTVSSVDLYYSVDGGATYPAGQVIATGLADDGSHTWTVPEVESALGRVKTVAWDDEGNSVESESEADVMIESAVQNVYDFAAGGGVDKWGWGDQTGNWSAVDGVRRPVNGPLSATAYARLASSNATGGDSDTNRYVSPQPAGPSESTHTFEFTIAENPARMHDIAIRWEGYADDSAQVEMYVWDAVESQWCDGNGRCGENRFMDNFAGNRDETLEGHIRSDFSRYLDGGILTVMIYVERSWNSSFHDYMSVTVTSDDCAGPDFDFDGIADACDNCVETANVLQANSDADPFGDACDCADGDSSVHAVPFEIENVSILSDTTTLSWDSDAGNSGSGTTYDVLRGTIGQFPVGTGAEETCASTGSSATTLGGLETPALGAGHYYLVRGSNACGTGSYGLGPGLTERTSTTCP